MARRFKDLTISIANLEKDGEDQHEFITALLCIGSIIDDVDRNEITRYIKNEPEVGSINLIRQLFTSNNMPVHEKSISMLRELQRIRSHIPPVHMGEADTIDSLNALGIRYPIENLRKALTICLTEFLGALRELTRILVP